MRNGLESACSVIEALVPPVSGPKEAKVSGTEGGGESGKGGGEVESGGGGGGGGVGGDGDGDGNGDGGPKSMQSPVTGCPFLLFFSTFPVTERHTAREGAIKHAKLMAQINDETW